VRLWRHKPKMRASQLQAAGETTMSKFSQQSLSMCLSVLVTLVMLVSMDELARTDAGMLTKTLAAVEQTLSVQPGA
jgi:hypothetical protein